VIALANENIPVFEQKFNEGLAIFNDLQSQQEKLEFKLNALNEKVSLSTNEVNNLNKYNADLSEISFKMTGVSDKLFGL
jgi:hypothetical protein